VSFVVAILLMLILANSGLAVSSSTQLRVLPQENAKRQLAFENSAASNTVDTTIDTQQKVEKALGVISFSYNSRHLHIVGEKPLAKVLLHNLRICETRIYQRN